MEEKSIKINAPEGYEIDEANSSFSEIKFKPIGIKYPKSWKDAFLHKQINGFYIQSNNNITDYVTDSSSKNETNVFKTEKQAKLALAYAQITQLMALPCYNGNWEPDWNNEDNKWIIRRYKYIVEKADFCGIYYAIAFKSREIRDAFYDNHMDLLKTYFELD